MFYGRPTTGVQYLFFSFFFWESLDARVSYSISCLSALFITAAAATIPLHQINRHRRSSRCVQSAVEDYVHSTRSRPPGRAGSDRGRRGGWRTGGGDVEPAAVTVAARRWGTTVHDRQTAERAVGGGGGAMTGRRAGAGKTVDISYIPSVKWAPRGAVRSRCPTANRRRLGFL